MRRFFFLMVLLSAASMMARAGFVATGGRTGQPYVRVPEASTGLSQVFLFNGIEGGELRFECADPSSCKWSQYVSHAAQSIPLSATVSGTASVLETIEAGRGYIVESGGMQYACFVLDYESLPLSYTALDPQTDAEDICESLQLSVKGTMDDFVYYTPDGKKCTLERVHTLTYDDVEWNATDGVYEEKTRTMEAEGYVSAFVIDAPLCDTEFRLKGDQFAQWFGLPAQEISAAFKALRVETHARAVTDDEKDEVSGLTLQGQAPMTVTFSAEASPAVSFLTWRLYVDPDDADYYLYRTEEEVEYTFEASGTFKVKLQVSNEVCSDSAEFTVTITESSLDCPNFFSPRSTPGENDEFRVAYQSLVKFHGRIMNRWGVTLFEWDDPDKGWDGTFNGKPVNPGVYFYIITATGSDGMEYLKRGDINLLE